MVAHVGFALQTGFILQDERVTELEAWSLEGQRQNYIWEPVDIDVTCAKSAEERVSNVAFQRVCNVDYFVVELLLEVLSRDEL